MPCRHTGTVQHQSTSCRTEFRRRGFASREVTYEIDAAHTHPSFEADHSGACPSGAASSTARRASTLDKQAGGSTVEVTIDVFDTAKYPTATYSGKLAGFSNGVTKPVTSTINSFKRAPDRSGREKCGAEASATINREDLGVVFGKTSGST